MAKKKAKAKTKKMTKAQRSKSAKKVAVTQKRNRGEPGDVITLL